MLMAGSGREGAGRRLLVDLTTIPEKPDLATKVDIGECLPHRRLHHRWQRILKFLPTHTPHPTHPYLPPRIACMHMRPTPSKQRSREEMACTVLLRMVDTSHAAYAPGPAPPPPQPPLQPTAGIITAFSPEVQAVLDRMDSILGKKTYSGRAFFIGKLG